MVYNHLFPERKYYKVVISLYEKCRRGIHRNHTRIVSIAFESRQSLEALMIPGRHVTKRLNRLNRLQTNNHIIKPPWHNLATAPVSKGEQIKSYFDLSPQTTGFLTDIPVQIWAAA